MPAAFSAGLTCVKAFLTLLSAMRQGFSSDDPNNVFDFLRFTQFRTAISERFSQKRNKSGLGTLFLLFVFFSLRPVISRRFHV